MKKNAVVKLKSFAVLLVNWSENVFQVTSFSKVMRPWPVNGETTMAAAASVAIVNGAKGKKKTILCRLDVPQIISCASGEYYDESCEFEGKTQSVPLENQME